MMVLYRLQWQRLAIGYEHALSKRTSVYADVALQPSKNQRFPIKVLQQVTA